MDSKKLIPCITLVLIVLADAFPWATERDVRCKDPGQISDGIKSPSQSFHSVGSVVRYKCVPGYEINGTASITCMSNGNWSDDAPTCEGKEILCKDPGGVKRGRKRLSRKNYRVGSRVHYQCLPGYRIEGKASIICKRNGKWSHKAPLCKKRQTRCKDPGKIKYGEKSVVKKTHRSGSKIHYRCYSGYKLNGTSSITCMKHGHWSRDAPTCQPISCGKPSLIKHGNYTVNEFTYRSVVTYKCDVGYELIGKPQRRCRSTGKWTKKPRCQIYKCRLSRQPRIRHGRTSTTDPTYSHGATLIFKCNKGYELIGTDSIACLEGKWSARRLPYCKVKACPNPGFPDNGRRIGNNFGIGRTVRFTCQSGFKLTGSPIRKCQKNKQWSGSVAVCDDESTDCPILGTPVSGRKIGNRYNFGSAVGFECKEGYVLQGSNIRHCMFNGKWNGTEAKCVDEFHYFVRGVNETALFFRKNMDMMLQYTCSGGNSTCKVSSNVDARARAIDLSDDGGLDVLFVFDASSSITKKEFKLATKFAELVVKELGTTWKSKGTRVACIIYGTETKLVFNLGSSGARTVKGVISKLRKIRKLGGGTATRRALEMAQKLVFPQRKSERQRAIFFITDGRSNIGGPPEKAAKVLRELHNVEIYAIGVGKDVNRQELHAIAVNIDDVIVVKNFTELFNSIKKAVTTTIDYSPCGESTYDPRARMVGGIRANRGRWPWQLGLHKNMKILCGGALIERGWVLTAAHCFLVNKKLHLDSNSYAIKAGDYHLEKKETSEREVQTEDIFVHPDYKPAKFDNDIALVKLQQKLDLGPFVRTVCLPKMNEKLLQPGNHGTVAGWGTTQKLLPGERPDPSHQGSKVLLQSAFTIQDNERCNASTTYHFNPTVTFCAGDGKGGNDTCKGDSGGSFVRHVPRDHGAHKWVSVGLVSWGEGCGQAKKYGFYTRVAPFVDWIKQVMRDNE